MGDGQKSLIFYGYVMKKLLLFNIFQIVECKQEEIYGKNAKKY